MVSIINRVRIIKIMEIVASYSQNGYEFYLILLLLTSF